MNRVFTQSDIDTYASVSGDRNPLHVDPAFAAETAFGGTVVHGLLVAAYAAQTLARPTAEGRPTSEPAADQFRPFAVEAIFVRPVPSGSTVDVHETAVNDPCLREVHALVAGEPAVIVRAGPTRTPAAGAPEPSSQERS